MCYSLFFLLERKKLTLHPGLGLKYENIYFILKEEVEISLWVKSNQCQLHMSLRYRKNNDGIQDQMILPINSDPLFVDELEEYVFLFFSYNI